jgi:Mn2+/Fe2+ NRAMP family transporter
MKPLVAALVACAIAALLYRSLDSGRYAAATPRLFSLPLIGLALIFGARAWTMSLSQDKRTAPFFAGLAIGVGGYALVRLFIARRLDDPSSTRRCVPGFASRRRRHPAAARRGLLLSTLSRATRGSP